MRFPVRNSLVAASTHCLLSWLLLGGAVVDGLALPIQENQADYLSVASASVRGISSVPPFAKEGDRHKVARVVTPLKPKPIINPADPVSPTKPDAPEPLAPGSEPDPKAPGAVKPNNPADAVPAPADVRLGQAPKANPKPDPKGPVPTEAEIALQCSIPENKAIFWSGTGDKVHNYKKDAGLVSDSGAFPEGYTQTFRSVDNAKDVEFAYRFSRVFAQTAKGEVRLMVPWESGPNPTRVFHTDEWPILKEGLATGRITKVIQVNPNNFKEERIYDPTIYGLTKREKVDLNNIPWDVNLDALNEAWKRSMK